MRSVALRHVSFKGNGTCDRPVLSLQLLAANTQIVSNNTYVDMNSLVMVTNGAVAGRRDPLSSTHLMLVRTYVTLHHMKQIVTGGAVG